MQTFRNHWKRATRTLQTSHFNNNFPPSAESRNLRFLQSLSIFGDSVISQDPKKKICQIPLEEWRKQKVPQNRESAILVSGINIPRCEETHGRNTENSETVTTPQRNTDTDTRTHTRTWKTIQSVRTGFALTPHSNNTYIVSKY